MKIDLFGPPRLCIGGTEQQHSSRKAMALLAYLAMRAGEPVTRQHLADLLWGDNEPEQARINLRQCLSQLRSLLGDSGAAAITTANDQLTLDPGMFDIPARQVLAGLPTDTAIMIAAGPGFLEGFSARSDGFETWMTAQRHLLETRLADTLEAGGNTRLAGGDAAGAARDFAMALKLDPFRETAHRGLIRAQADLGKTAMALAQFEKCRTMLKTQLGVEPDTETRELAAQIRASRLRKAAGPQPMFERFTSDHPVVVFREAPGPAGQLRELARGSATDALQAALDTIRAEGVAQSARVVAVPDTGDPAQERRLATTTAALHSGAGFLATLAVYRLFENWSPFCFAPAPAGDGAYYLLLGEMPRHRLQIAPTISRPTAKFTAPNSVVVLPFRDHSPDAGRLNLGDVISEEIITRLARFRHLKVAGPTAGQTCRALGLSVEEVHERLGVNYAVDGSVARLGDRLIITFSITELKTNTLVHGERFEGKFHDLFEQQSVIVDRIASNLFNRTQDAEIDRLSARLTNNIGAYELYLSGLASHRRSGISTQNARQAVQHFNDAILIDPEFVRARAYRLCSLSWYESDLVDEIGMAEIGRLLVVDENDAEVHRIAGALHHYRGDFDAAVAHIERAVQLNPSDAYLIANSAVYRAYAGDGDGGLRLIERAMEVDPFLPAWCVEDHGVVLYAIGDYAQAVTSLRRLPVPSPRALAYLAAALVALGDPVAANLAVERIRRIAPDFKFNEFMHWAAFKEDAIREGLRVRLGQAGLA